MALDGLVSPGLASSVALGLVAAATFALAAAAQHGVTRSLAGSGIRVIVPTLLRHPLWLAGFFGNVLGFLLHAAALRIGDLGVIQAVLVTQLLFALPLAGRARSSGRPSAREWVGTAAVCAGIATLILVRSGRTQTVDPTDPLLVAGLGGATMVTLLVLAARARADVRTAVIGLAAGVGFSITATFIVVLTHDGLGWPVLGLAASGGIAAVLVQAAYASGSFPVALTAMSIADPIASWVWAVLVLDEAPVGSPWAWGSYAASALLLGLGVALLSPALSPLAPGARVAE